MVLILVSVIFSVPVNRYLNNSVHTKIINVFTTIGLACCTIAAVSYVYMGSYNPFLYFMF